MKAPQTMQRAPVNRTTKAAVRVASVAPSTVLAPVVTAHGD